MCPFANTFSRVFLWNAVACLQDLRKRRKLVLRSLLDGQQVGEISKTRHSAQWSRFHRISGCFLSVIMGKDYAAFLFNKAASHCNCYTYRECLPRYLMRFTMLRRHAMQIVSNQASRIIPSSFPCHPSSQVPSPPYQPSPSRHSTSTSPPS